MTGFARPELLATTDWLAERLDDPSIRIVDCDEFPAYQRLHIPGAVGLRVHHYLKDPDNPDHLMPPEMFARAMSEHGIGDEHTVVAYDGFGGLYAARLWWALDYYGHSDCKVLNGGFQKWFAEARPVTRVKAHLPAGRHGVGPATFTVRPGRDCLCTLDDVEAATGREGTVIWDVRSREEHTGENRRQNRYGGRIPGAVHLEWLDLTSRGDAPELLPPDEIRRRLASAGITPESEVLAH